MASIARGIIGGIAGAAGDPNTQQQMVQANQQAEAQKQNELKAKIAPLGLAIKNLQTGVQSAYGQYQQAHPEWQGDFDTWKTGPGSQQFNQFVDQTQGVVHSMRELLHPDHQSGPTDWLKTHLTDRAHITNADHRAEDQANDQAWNKYNEGQFTQKATTVVPPDETPAAKAEKQKFTNAQTLESQKLTGQLDLENKKLESAQKIEAAKEANAQTLEDKKVAEQNKIELIKQQMFNRSQERIERMHNAGSGAIGTWAVQEDAEGNPVLFNSKTGQTKAPPEGMHKSGYYAKQVAPLEAATENIKGYMEGGVFTGPGDLDLQHQYFTATQPATGFRMTKVQQDILADSQNWINKGKAAWGHLTGGTIFSPEQRKQIAEEAQNAIAAKKRALNVGGPQTEKLRQMQGGGGVSDDDIIKALSGAK